MRFLFAALLAALIGVAGASAQVPPVTPASPTPAAAKQPAESAKQPEVAAESALELPADQTVEADEGFVTITAKTKAKQVRWLVVAMAGGGKVKYLPVDLTNSVVVSVPPNPGTVIAVFAVANVDGQLTDFARTTITVKGGPAPPGPNPPGPPTPPGPNPPGPTPPGPVAGPLHVTFVVDLNKSTPATAQLLNSPTLREKVTKGGAFFRLYDAASPVVARKKIDTVYKRVGQPAMLMVQDNNGKVLAAEAVPATEQAILESIERAAAGGK